MPSIILREGRKLNQAQVVELEEAIAQGAADALTLRQKLLGYYFGKESAKRHALVLWFIENEPDSETAGRPECWEDFMQNPEFYQAAAAAWEAQISRQPRNLAILRNAASFYTVDKLERARELLENAYALESDNPDWADRLAHLHQLKSQPTGSEPPVDPKEQYRIALRYRRETLAVADAEMRFSELGNAALLALRAGEPVAASAYARELLDTAPRYHQNWNYGNAIFEGHSILGELALDEGNLPLALEHLRASANTPGSPHLNHGAPDMTLANRLLAQGERDAVHAFLDEISRFWQDSEKLDYFRKEIQQGRTPDLTGPYPPMASRF